MVKLAPSNSQLSSAAAKRRQPAAENMVSVREYQGDKVVTYTRSADGFVSSDNAPSEANWLARTGRKIWESVVPENVSASVSEDYVPTRRWQVARDFFGAFGGTAAATATIAAIGAANSAVAALGIAGINLANIGWVQKRLPKLAPLVSAGLAKKAEQNPRPWLMAIDLLKHSSVMIQSATAFLPPTLYYPLMIGVAAAEKGAKAVEEAGGANINPRQAVADNLAEITIKNTNQSTIAGLLGATTSLVAIGALTPVLGFAATAMTVSAVGVAGGLFSKYNMLENLDYIPVNESAVRRLVDGLEKDGKVAGPKKNLISHLPSLFQRNKFVVGDSVAPLLEDPNFPQLRELFNDRGYIVSVNEGSPHIILKDDLDTDADDPRTAQSGLPETSDFARKMMEVQATFQAVHAEKLLDSPEYQKRVDTDGVDRANLWVSEQSLAKTPANFQPILEDMKAQGWSVDTIRFDGESRPIEIGGSQE